MTTRAPFFPYLLLASLFFNLGCDKQIFTGKREARGVWMSRFEYTSDSLRGNPPAARKHILSVLERARKARFNMVFFQIRGNADAFYEPGLEPWSSLLTETLGKNPGWDPLAFAVEEGHRLGLELHAWMNTFPVWRGPSLPAESSPPQIARVHPDWIVCDSAGIPMSLEQNGYVWGSPGNPAVREHILNVVRDLVQRYDLDGIHFDYIRYPEGSAEAGYSHDSVSVARYHSRESNPARLAWDDWQREQVNTFVFDAYNTITGIKPWVKMSAAVIGKYDGSGWTSYNAVYQDPRRWMELGKIDFIVPMVYWQRSHPTHPFVPLIAQWQDRVAFDRQVVPGLSAGLQKKFGWRELSAQIDAVRKQGLPGVVFFASGGLEHAWEILGVDEFPYWSLPPVMPWKDGIPPLAPYDVSAEPTGSAIRLTWKSDTSEVVSFVVYRSARGRIETDNALQILTVTARGMHAFLDADPLPGGAVYAVTSVDRLGNESERNAMVHVPAEVLAGISPGARSPQTQ